MDAIFCCLDREICLKALTFLVSKNITVRCCLVKELREENSLLKEYCDKNGIKLYLTQERDRIEKSFGEKEVDLLISFAYSLKLSERIINRAKTSINFHPAPLPKYRGCGTTSHGIFNEETEWGVSCHFLENSIDAGGIIASRSFSIDKGRFHTGMQLSRYSWDICFELLQEVIESYLSGDELHSAPQGEGRYYSKKSLEELKEIDSHDSSDVIERKVKALWYPPYEGAYIRIEGKKFYLIDEDILKECGKMYSKLD